METLEKKLKKSTLHGEAKQNIINYYYETSEDYAGWSKNYNMHFGYFRFKGWKHCIKNIWRLEPQLNQATQEVFVQLAIKNNAHYLDMGCGYGASARLFAKQYPASKLTGVSIVSTQVKQAKNLLQKQCPHSVNVDFQQMDYQNTAFENESFEGVYAMESACHGSGNGRPDFLAEAFRLLKPGGALVVHDAFTLKPQQTHDINLIYKWAYKWLCKGWAVEDYINKKAFETELINQGFKDIHFKNAFWNVLPSAIHMPKTILLYIFTKMLFSKDFYINKSLQKQRIHHCLGSFSAILVALHTKRFGYYIVTAKK